MIKHLTDGDIMNSPSAGKNKINEIIDVVNSLKYRIDCLHVDTSGHLCSQEQGKSCETCRCSKTVTKYECLGIGKEHCVSFGHTYWQPKEGV